MTITAMLMFWVRLPAFSWRQMYGIPGCVLVRLDPLCNESGCPRVYLLICISKDRRFLDCKELITHLQFK